jgi:hypothetical protein
MGTFIVVAALLLAQPSVAPAPSPPARTSIPAAPAVVSEVGRLVEIARQRFEARDTAGVLAHVSDGYRSAGLTKATVRQHLLTMFTLYQEVRARVRVDRVDIVDDATWIYTTGEITGRLPMMGWVSVWSWEREPEVVRREATGWRLIGFQD